jgi:hypothetical protein
MSDDIGQHRRDLVADLPVDRVVVAAIANLANSGSTALVVVFLVRVAGFGSAAVGLLMAATGVGGIAGAMVARRGGWEQRARCCYACSAAGCSRCSSR